MCAKFQLSGQRLTLDPIDLIFGPYYSVSLTEMHCIARLYDGLLLYRANSKTKQLNMMQFSVYLEQHINILFY